MKNLLIHTCCAPCLAYPLEFLKTNSNSDFEITAYFYNPNIHPYKEFNNRKNTLIEFCKINKIDLITENYGLNAWLKFVEPVDKTKQNRCLKCYEMRLIDAAKKTKKLGIKNFTTTLLYSKYQYHDLIKNLGFQIANDFNLEFFYEDFRTGWEQGFEIFRSYKQNGFYTQNYCGCIFSEEERFKK